MDCLKYTNPKQLTGQVKHKKANMYVLNGLMALPLDPVGEPVCSFVVGPVCPTSRLSLFIDALIKPLISCVRNYIRDDIYFLTKLQGLKSDNEPGILESLYTNITPELACEALQYWLKRKGEQVVDKDIVVRAVELILRKHIFFLDPEFSDKHVL